MDEKFIGVCALAYCRYELIPFTCFHCSGVSSCCDEGKSLNRLGKLLIRSSGNSQHGKEMNLSKNPVSFNTKRAISRPMSNSEMRHETFINLFTRQLHLTFSKSRQCMTGMCFTSRVQKLRVVSCPFFWNTAGFTIEESQ